MKKWTLIFFGLVLAVCARAQSQSVGIGTINPNANAQLDITSADKGLLIPRVALTATNSASPLNAFVAGMMVYNTATAGVSPSQVTPGFYYCDGVKWQRVSVGSTDQTIDVSGLGSGLTSPNSFSGATFSPNTPASTDYIYINTADGSTWTYNGSQYVSSPIVANTAWYLANSITDAGSTKSSSIYRVGPVGIGTNKIPDASAQLDVNSTSKGFLLPRMTTAQRDAMASPATGLQIYNTDKNCMEYFNGSSWISTCGSSVNGTGNLDCGSAQVSGVYQVGYTTTSSNYITIPVNVVTAGSWTASSNSQNGISFTGGGVFAGPGQATITLYATTGVNPPSNGVFNYTITLGASVCNVSVNFNSLPACTTPTPALTPTTSVCAIPKNSSQVFTVTGGTTNSTAFTYSISPAAGVSAATGNVTSGATPSVTFANAGTYTITYTATNAGATCASSSINASQTFTVSNQTAPATSVICTSHDINATNLPAAGSSFNTTIGGVGVNITRSGTGTNGTFVANAPSCANAVNTSSAFNGSGTYTFTFDQPVKDLSFFCSADQTGDSYKFTAMNGNTDVTSSLVLTKLCPAQGFNITNCNQVTLPSGNTTGQAINIGGVYYTSLTFTLLSSSDAQFDIGTCNAASNGCQSPSPALSATSAGPVPFGGSRAFTVRGGTSNTTSFTYSITPATGVSAPTGTVSGGTTPSITFTAVGTYTIKFTATNTCGTGNPNTISTSYSFLVAPLAAAPTTNTICTSRINSTVLPSSGSTYTTSIGGVTTTITRSGYVNSGTYVATAPSCSAAVNSSSAFAEGGGNGNMTFTFSQPVSNISLFSSMDVSGDNLKLTASYNGADVTNALALTKLCPAQGFNISTNNITLPSTNQTGQAVNVGGVYFTSLTLNMTGQDIQYDLGVCNAGTNVCPLSAVTTSFSNGKNVATGGSTTVTASATNATSYNWTTTTLGGVYTGTTSGTGTSATLTSSSWAVIAITYTATNNCGIPSTTATATKTDTVFFVNTPAASANTVCTTLPNVSSYPVVNTISSQSVTTSISGTTSTGSSSNTQCGTTSVSNGVNQASGNSTTYTFSRPVSNISLFAGNCEPTENEGFSIIATLGGVPVNINLNKYGSTCAGTFNISGTTIQIPSGSSNTTNSVYVDVSGAYFDKLVISRVGTSNGTNVHKLGYCNAVSNP